MDDADLLRKFTLDFNYKGKFGGLDAFKYTLSNSTFEPAATFRDNCAYGNDAPQGKSRALSFMTSWSMVQLERALCLQERLAVASTTNTDHC